MPSKSGSRAASAVGITRSVQPTSAIDSPVSRLRAALAIRDETRRGQASRRSTRTPQTTSTPSPSAASSIGTSAGSFWRSASSVATQGARAWRKPAASAADWPRLTPSESARWRRSARASSASARALPSVDPSSTHSTS